MKPPLEFRPPQLVASRQIVLPAAKSSQPAANKAKAVPHKPKPKTPAKSLPKPSNGKFHKPTYQNLYMVDRRQADKLGFGGTKALNTQYKTVSEFRKWRVEQERVKK